MKSDAVVQRLFANRLRTDFYSCSGHTRGVRFPAAPSEDVLPDVPMGQRMNELAGLPCNRRKRLCLRSYSRSPRRWESGKRSLLSTFPSAGLQPGLAKTLSSKHTPFRSSAHCGEQLARQWDQRHLRGFSPLQSCNPRLRCRRALHSDIWIGSAAELVRRDALAIYPIGGWWKEKPQLGRYNRDVRYSLCISLRALAAQDIYTPIAIALGIPIAAIIE